MNCIKGIVFKSRNAIRYMCGRPPWSIRAVFIHPMTRYGKLQQVSSLQLREVQMKKTTVVLFWDSIIQRDIQGMQLQTQINLHGTGLATGFTSFTIDNRIEHGLEMGSLRCSIHVAHHRPLLHINLWFCALNNQPHSVNKKHGQFAAQSRAWIATVIQ